MSIDLWKQELDNLIEMYKRDCKKGTKGCIYSRLRLRIDISSLQGYINQLGDIHG